MSKAQLLEREERFARPVAIATLIGVALLVVGFAIEFTSGSSGGEAKQLHTLHHQLDAIFAASILQAVGFLLLAPVLLYLFRAAQGRSERVRREMVVFVFLAPVLFAAQSVVSGFAAKQVDRRYRHHAAKHIYHHHLNRLAKHIVDHASLAQASKVLLLPALFALVVALIYIPLQALRCGLVPRFWGSLAIAAGAASLLLGTLALIAALIFFAYLALMISGVLPGGRPPAWAAGEAIPWPKPGEATDGGAVRGSGRELKDEQQEGEAAAPVPAAPQKRKRKRRR